MSWWRRLFGSGSEAPTASTADPPAAAPPDVPAAPALPPAAARAAITANSKVDIGACASCGRTVKAKATSVRPTMKLTCKCGQMNQLEVSSEIVKAVNAALRPAPELDETTRAVIEMRDALLAIYGATKMKPGEGGISYRDATDADARAKIRAIGERAARAGGFDLMRRVHDEFRQKAHGLDPSWIRNLETQWDGIGGWLK